MSRRGSYTQKVGWFRLIGLVLLGVLLWPLDFAALARMILDVDPYLLVMAVFLNLPMVLLKSIRWQTLMLPQSIHYSVGRAYLAYFGSIFIGFFTPGRLGEFVKALHVKQDCHVHMGQALSSVLADRLFDLYALLVVGGMALLSLATWRDNTAVLMWALLAFILILPLAMFLHESVFGYIRKLGSRLGRFGRWLFAPQGWLLELRNGLRQLSPPWLLVAVGLTVLAYAIFFSQCYMLALALQIPASFTSITYSVALGSLVTLLPISISGLGTREAAITAYLGMVGVSPEAALSFSLLVFVTFYVVGGLMGAVAWCVKPVKLRYGNDIRDNDS